MTRQPPKARRGSALMLVLIFMTAMLMIGLPLLMAAQMSVQRGVVHTEATGLYYAAESGAQLAAQVFTGELQKLQNVADEVGEGESPFFMVFNGDEAEWDTTWGTMPEAPLDDDKLEELKNIFKSRLETDLTEAYKTAKDAVEEIDTTFNGELVTLADDLGGLDGIDEFISCETDEENPGEYPVVVSLGKNELAEELSFYIEATSGGRTVRLDTNTKTDITVTIEPGTGGNDGGGGDGGTPPPEDGALPADPGYGVYYTNKTGDLFGSQATGQTLAQYAQQKNEQYEKYLAALDLMYQDLNCEVNCYRRNPGRILGSTSSSPSAFNPATAGKDMQYIHSSGYVDLASGTYPNLRYICAGGQLTINGPVNCPNLEAIYVTNGTMSINGTFNCPKLRDCAVESSLNIMPNASINPMTAAQAVDTAYLAEMSEKVCNFYAASVSINCPAEVNWCRFIAEATISVDYGTNGTLKSNSIFSSGARQYQSQFNISGTQSSVTDGVIPQFYLRLPTGNNVAVFNSPTNISRFTGVIMTRLRDNFSYTASSLQRPFIYTGLFVGDIRIAAHAGNTARPFAQKEIDLMRYMPGSIAYYLDGGERLPCASCPGCRNGACGAGCNCGPEDNHYSSFVPAAEPPESPAPPVANVTYELNFSGPTLREITGEG